MTIVNAGRNRMAVVGASTWTYFGIGVGAATVSIADTDLGSLVSPRVLANIASASANVVFYRSVFDKTYAPASNITEIGLFDASTGGNILFRTVASTATWTSFAKTSTNYAIISTSITFSS